MNDPVQRNLEGPSADAWGWSRFDALWLAASIGIAQNDWTLRVDGDGVVVDIVFLLQWCELQWLEDVIVV